MVNVNARLKQTDGGILKILEAIVYEAYCLGYRDASHDKKSEDLE